MRWLVAGHFAVYNCVTSNSLIRTLPSLTRLFERECIVSTRDLSDHLREDRYGDFNLTDAVRPSLDLQVVPVQAFRVGRYRDPAVGLEVPVLAASISRELLFDVFLHLLEPLGPVVDVVLETSHESAGNKHSDLCRAQIDLPVLQSHFCEFEDLIVNDGCTGVAVVAAHEPIELQFDEHKLLIVYAKNLQPFIRILLECGVPRDDTLRLLSEGEHFHTTDPRFASAFEQLAYRLGVAERAERVNW